LKPNRLEIVGLAAAVVTSWLCVRGALDASEAYQIGRSMTAGTKTLGLAGWAIATFGPMAVAILFWRLSKRVRARWLVHLLFLPCAIALLIAGEALMLHVTGTLDFDDTLGAPEMQAALMFLIAAGAYLAAILSTLSPFRRKRAGDARP
jgi:endonuclease/exonuclease/phosphatase (EEP) superfamily protein YafD